MADTLYVCFTLYGDGAVCCYNFPITTSDGGNTWTGSATATGCTTLAASLACTGPSWSIQIGEVNYGLTVNSCSPLNFSNTDDETYSVTITDVENSDCCCPCNLPASLIITATVDGCDCLNGQTWNLSYDGELGGWTGGTTICDQSFSVTLVCTDGTYILEGNAMTVNSCDPVNLSVTFLDTSNWTGCGDITVTYTITS